MGGGGGEGVEVLLEVPIIMCKIKLKSRKILAGWWTDTTATVAKEIKKKRNFVKYDLKKGKE